MSINMSPCGSTLEEQLSSVMDVLAKAAVSEISQLFSEGSATLRLQITESRKENEALKTSMKVMRSELFSLRLQARANASRPPSRFALSRGNICKPRTASLGNEDCNALRDRSTPRGTTSDSLHVDAPGSSHVSSHNGELRILHVYGHGEGPLAVDGHDALFTTSELEALNSLSAHNSGAKSLDVGEQLVRHMELTSQQIPDTILIKDEEDIGGGMPAVEDCNDIRDCSTEYGATLDSLHPDGPGSSHMSSHNGELRILSVHGHGGDQLLVDGHDTIFTASEVDGLSSLSVDHSVAKSLDCGERLVHRKELTGRRGGRKGLPCVLCGKVFPNNSKMTIHMRTHTSEKPYRCGQCMKRFSQRCNLKIHMTIHSREKPYRCDQCMKGFKRSNDLKIHMRIHSGEKPYRCDQCMMRFRQRCHLKIHMRIHSREKPYRCDQCMKAFRQSYNLKIHMRIHSGEKPCVCPQCKDRYSDPSRLRLHMINVHGNGVL